MFKKSYIIFAVLVIVLGVLLYFVFSKPGAEKPAGKGKLFAPPTEPKVVLPEEAGAGKIGEIPQDSKEKEIWEAALKESPSSLARGGVKEPDKTSLPPMVFNTTGLIKEVGEDRIVVFGNGSNFADGVQRDLTVIFSDSTILFSPGQTVHLKGKDGLKYLKPGMEISIEGEENIRGRTEFTGRHINIL